MERIAFSQYTPATHAEQDLAACADELRREIATRKRLYDRWLAEGQMTYKEGHDRMSGIMGALRYLNECVPDGSQLKPAEKPF